MYLAQIHANTYTLSAEAFPNLVAELCITVLSGVPVCVCVCVYVCIFARGHMCARVLVFEPVCLCM